VSETTELRKTPLHAEHVALGGKIVPFAGWYLPVQYSGLVPEHKAVRTAAGIFDVSHMGEMILEGAKAAQAIDGLVTGDIVALPVGKALYTVCCNEQGTILDDLIVYRRAQDRFLIVMNASNRDKIAAHFGPRVAKHGVSFEDASDRFALLAIQGPKAVEVVKAAGGDAAITGLSSFSLTDGTVAGVKVIAARTGYTAEDGFELFCANEDAVQLWRGLIEAGKAFGLLPAGLGARDTLRLEGRLSLYGNEIDETTNPLEAGLGWVVKLDKPGDFLGKAALKAVQAAGLTRKMVGLEMVGKGIARHGYPIVAADAEPGSAPIGIVTSGSPAPSLDKNIGLGYVPAALAAVGTKIGVEIRGKVIEAVVVKTPFYKRSR
jgi:aminomethyltransferase